MSKMKALVCRECGKEYPPKAIHVCEMCFGPLEVKYNYDEIKSTISRKKIEQGPNSMWRYIDLLREHMDTQFTEQRRQAAADRAALEAQLAELRKQLENSK